MEKINNIEVWVANSIIKLSKKHKIKKEKVSAIIVDWHDLRDKELTLECSCTKYKLN